MVAFMVAAWYCYVRAQTRPFWGGLAAACALLAYFTKAAAIFFVAALGIEAMLILFRPTTADSQASRKAAMATLAGLVICGIVALAARSREVRHLVLCGFAAVLAFVALGKVLSPQFMIWLAPFAAICAAWRLYVPALLCTGAFVLTLVEFPGRYFDLVHEENGIVLLVALRNALLVAALIATLAALTRSPRPGAPPRRSG